MRNMGFQRGKLQLYFMYYDNDKGKVLKMAAAYSTFH